MARGGRRRRRSKLDKNHPDQPAKPDLVEKGEQTFGLVIGKVEVTTGHIYRQSLFKIPPVKNTSSNNTHHIFHPFSRCP